MTKMSFARRPFSDPPPCGRCHMPKMSYVGVEHTETETPLVMHAFTCQMCSTTLQVLATVSRPEEWFHWVDYVMSRTISFETT